MWGVHWPVFSIAGWCPGLPGAAELGTSWLSCSDLWDAVTLALGAFSRWHVGWGPNQNTSCDSLAKSSPGKSLAVCWLQTSPDWQNVEISFCFVLVWLLKINEQYIYGPTQVPKVDDVSVKTQRNEWPQGVSRVALYTDLKEVSVGRRV